MYKVSKARRRFERLINYIAYRYAIKDHFRLSKEELISEGMMVLVRCCNDFPPGQIKFGRYFKRALYNHIQNLHRFHKQEKRLGYETELLEALAIPVRKVTIPCRDNVLAVVPHLTPNTRRFLLTLANPPQGLYEFAYEDFCKRNQWHLQGKRISGWRQFRIAPRHIRGYLEMTPHTVREAIKEIREVRRCHAVKS